MPTNDYTSPGNYSFQTPFATKNVTATCIGGGGSGYKDETADDRGGGGGGGGFARSTRTVGAGITFLITVGRGGQRLGNNTRTGGDGQASICRATTGILIVVADGGEAGFDDNGGGQAGDGTTGDIQTSGQNGEDDDDGGKGGGAGNQNGNSGRCNSPRAGGRGTALDGSAAGGSCTGDRDGGTYGGGGGGNNSGFGGVGADGAVRIQWDYYAPVITSFTGSTQTSISGTPSDTVSLSWATQYANSISINNGVGSVIGIGSSGIINIDSNLQSVAGSNSPASKTYTMTASGPGGTVTANATVFVFNDNTPNDFNLPSTTTSGVNINNLQPNTQYQIQSPSITGIDMLTSVICPAGLEVSTNQSNWASFIYITNGQSIFFRFTSQPFNTDPNGAINSRTYNYTVGTLSKSFSISTRAPDVGELFDFGDSSVNYPYPDIDQITNTPTQYIVSPTTVVMADSGTPPDAEIPVEIKVNNPNVQIRIKPSGNATFGSWQSVRQI